MVLRTIQRSGEREVFSVSGKVGDPPSRQDCSPGGACGNPQAALNFSVRTGLAAPSCSFTPAMSLLPV